MYMYEIPKYINLTYTVNIYVARVNGITYNKTVYCLLLIYLFFF